MDQRETLAGTAVSTWGGGLSDRAKNCLILGGLGLGGLLTLVWIALLAWQVWSFIV